MASVGLVCTFLNSFSAGPSTVAAAGNRTGSAGTQANCNGPYCHGAPSSGIITGIQLSRNGTPVSSYTPNTTYTVNLLAATTTGFRPYFGFQFSGVKESSTATQAGTFAVGSTANIAVRTVGGLSIVEHTSKLSGTGAGSNWAYQTSFNWTSPAAGTGNVKFFTTILSSDGNAAATNDSANTASLVITESTVGIGSSTAAMKPAAWPNPATGQFKIGAETAESGRYTVSVYSLSGQKMADHAFTHPGGAMHYDVPCAGWAAGQYLVYLRLGDKIWSLPLTRN